ncbi:uncharacterized protein [Rutidosis leptorrhynchoides]|uniref:uncharacterized protein n=1 Tax=Rutidosis leptorrhynchoides TaxID=125765 RepID=UPI003A99A95B
MLQKAPFDSNTKFVRKCFACSDPNHLISECPKRKNEKAFLGGAWDEEENETQEEGKEICLMAIHAPSSERDDKACLVGQIDNEVLPNSFEFNFDNFVKLCDLSSRVSTSNANLKEENSSLKLEVCLNGVVQEEDWIIDSGCTTHMTGKKDFFTRYKEHNGGDVIFGGDVRLKSSVKIFVSLPFMTLPLCGIGDLGMEYLTKFEPKAYEGVFLGYSLESKAYRVLNKYTNVIEESLDVNFDETPPPKSKPLVDDDVIEQEAIVSSTNQNESKEVEETNEKESHLENDSSKDNLESTTDLKHIKDHPIEQFGMENSKPMATRMATNVKLTLEGEGDSFDSTKYRGMIGSLLYLMAS